MKMGALREELRLHKVVSEHRFRDKILKGLFNRYPLIIKKVKHFAEQFQKRSDESPLTMKENYRLARILFLENQGKKDRKDNDFLGYLKDLLWEGNDAILCSSLESRAADLKTLEKIFDGIDLLLEKNIHDRDQLLRVIKSHDPCQTATNLIGLVDNNISYPYTQDFVAKTELMSTECIYALLQLRANDALNADTVLELERAKNGKEYPTQKLDELVTKKKHLKGGSSYADLVNSSALAASKTAQDIPRDSVSTVSMRKM